MIWCSLENANRQIPNTVRFTQALEWLRSAVQEGNTVRTWLESATAKSTERVEIQGDELYASLICYETVTGAPAELETHRRYVDIQFIWQGEEGIAVADQAGLPIQMPYDATKDCAFVTATSPEVLAMQTGYLAVLFPEDAHAAQVALGTPQRVSKIVVKVRID